MRMLMKLLIFFTSINLRQIQILILYWSQQSNYKITLIAPSTPVLATPIMIPAKSTPPMQANTLDLKSISKILAASVPVHAPVPGNGRPTKISNAQGSPRPAVSFNFSRKEENDWNWKHISNNTNNIRL